MPVARAGWGIGGVEELLLGLIERRANQKRARCERRMREMGIMAVRTKSCWWSWMGLVVEESEQGKETSMLVARMVSEVSEERWRYKAYSALERRGGIDCGQSRILVGGFGLY